MSTSVRPGDDFYAYVNEGWLKSTSMPAGSSAYGTFNVVNEKNQERIRTIIHEAANSTSATGSMRQVKELYLGYLNTDHIEKLGIAPIQQDIHHLLALKKLRRCGEVNGRYAVYVDC